MILSSLIEDLTCCIVSGDTSKEINSLVYFSKDAASGSMFFAIEGTRTSGSQYIEEAVEKGATAIAGKTGSLESFREDEKFSHVTLIECEDVRKTMAWVSKKFYKNPADKMTIIGVTGTKGKTSTCFMIKEILNRAGIKTGIIGTVENSCPGFCEEAGHTTPQSADVYRLLSIMKKQNCKAAVIEVSSQGLMQSRVEGIDFDIAVFTNFSSDHIGPYEHKDACEYMGWKRSLFKNCKTAVINGDDPLADYMIQGTSAKRVVTFGRNGVKDYIFEKIFLLKSDSGLGTEYTVQGEKIRLDLPGMFNVENSVAAAAAARLMKVGWEDIKAGLRRVRIPGRCEIVRTDKKFTVMVDYAHNGKALKELLCSLRQYNPSSLTVVFGCGGDRAKERRRGMGKAAGEYADFSVITSDNPRNEDPMEIINDVVEAVETTGGPYRVIPHRGEAIRWAMRNGLEDSIIVIAGKGHEKYQIIGERKIFFDDREYVLKIDDRGEEDEKDKYQ